MSPSADVLNRWVALHGALAAQHAGSLDRAAQRWRRVAAREAKSPPLALFSQVAWDDVWQRPQEMARGLARRRPVLFVSPVQLHQAAGPLAGRWEPVRTEQRGRLTILSPLLLTGEYRSGWARSINRAILTRALQPFLRGIGATLMTNSPFCDFLVPALRPRRLVVDLIDDFCSFEWAPADGRRREARLLRNADRVIAGTHALSEKYRRRCGRIEYLPSGVDFDKLVAPADEPDELRALPRPRLLYVGSLTDRIDGELVEATARAFPEASVVLVGPRRASFRAPTFPGNVHELGLRPHDALPGFYQHCDAGLMPFADNAAARAINPVKTLEYFACGLPVISTPIPDVERFYSEVATVAPPRDWNDALRALLENDDADARAARVAFARGRSWRATVERLDAILREVEGDAAP